MKKTFLIFTAIVLMPVFASALDFEMSLKDRINSINIEASASSGPDRVAGALAIELGMKQEFILRQKAETGLSWGDLSVALYISNRTGKDITIIVNDFRRGKGHAWGRVAKAYGIRTDDLLSTMGKAHEASKQHGKGHGKMGDDKYLFVEHVPAEVCARCGEKMYSPEVTDELLKFAKDKFKPVKTVKVPVFDFAIHR